MIILKTKKILPLFLVFSLFLIYPAFSNAEESNLFLEATDNQKVFVPNEELNSWLQEKYYLSAKKNYHSVIETTKFCPLNKMACFLTKTTRQSYNTKKKSVIIIKTSRIKSFLQNIAKQFDQNPVNATFTITDGRVSAFSLGQNGRKLNIDKSIALISNFLKNKNPSGNTIKLIYDNVEPEIKSADANRLGIKTLIGEGKSNFSGSTRSRIHNIQVAVSRFNGLLIKPGEEFSFVQNLGPVDGKHGYKPELVIKNNVTTPEFGGGICQVSTTVFRAAVYSGLKITARKNHAYPVHYYNPQGFDATVYIPRPDLKFINNTPGYILIQAHIDLEKKELTFDFYGTDDGRKVEIDGPHIISRGAGGAMKTIFTQKVFDAKGDMIINDSFKSNYASPSKYPHPGQTTTLTKKPKGWSKKQWAAYKREHHL
ncbi:MAG TPA: hypothetical protein ENJ49_01075 [Candidatus Moranbacteria bacterium]|nr:hypothetical protein [Candidatus Moranbacteria bacterium]